MFGEKFILLKMLSREGLKTVLIMLYTLHIYLYTLMIKFHKDLFSMFAPSQLHPVPMFPICETHQATQVGEQTHKFC